MQQKVPFTIHQTPLGTPVVGTAVFDPKTTRVTFPEDAGIGTDAAWLACMESSCTLDIRRGRKHFVLYRDGAWYKEWRRVLVQDSQAARSGCVTEPHPLVPNFGLWNVTEGDQNGQPVACNYLQLKSA